MTDNLSIWNALGKTDPAHTKAFSRAGGFKGTAIKPQWVVMRLTEQFGPVGLGWGVGEPSFQVVPVGNEVMVYCTVSAWHTDRANTFYGVGGDKVSVSRQSGQFNDDEAFKKAFTDAVMNAFKFVGVAADVHMGRFDDNKYVAEVRQEFSGDTPRAAPANGLGTEKRDTGPGSMDGKDWWDAEGPGCSPAAAKRDEAMAEAAAAARTAFRDVEHEGDWHNAVAHFGPLIVPMPRVWRTLLRDEADTAADRLGIFPADRKPNTNQKAA